MTTARPLAVYIADQPIVDRAGICHQCPTPFALGDDVVAVPDSDRTAMMATCTDCAPAEPRAPRREFPA